LDWDGDMKNSSKRLKKLVLVLCLFSIGSLSMATFLLLNPSSAAMQEPDSRFAVNAFILNRYNWEEWDKPIQSLKNLNVGWAREEFVWSQIEPSKGVYDWAFYDRAYSKISESNINVLAILDYSAPWATSDPKRADADKYMSNIDDWRNYVGKIVDRYGGKIKYWQIWNEENISIFLKTDQGVSDYYSLLKNAYEVIKSKDSSANVVLGGTSGVDVGYLKALRDLGGYNYIDILAVHPYRLDFKSPPESGLIQDIIKAEKIAEEFNNKPIWFTELGWPTDSTEGVSEDIQASYLVRTYLMSFAFPDIKKIFWYDLRDDGNDKNYREHNFGIIKRDYSPKKSFYAFQNLVKILQYSQFGKINRNGEGGIFDYSFSKNEENIRAVWKINGNSQMVIDDPNNNIKIFDYIGKELNIQNDHGVKNLTISDFPIFIISGNKTSIESSISFSQKNSYEYIAQSPHISLKSEEERQVWLKIKNTGDMVWNNDQVVLGTCRNIDRGSGFFVDGNWLAISRPARMEELTVKNGETATFRFRVKSNGLMDGTYREYFCPLIEGFAWMEDKGVYWDIEVSNIDQEDKTGDQFGYSYTYIGQSTNPVLKNGEKTQLVLKLKNTGSRNWEKGSFNLGTSRNKDRVSELSNNWGYPNRILLDQSLVKPGEIGTFTVNLSANDKNGVFKEYFRPVVEGVGWMRDIGIYWKIRVDS